MIANWIHEENLQSFLEILASIVNYEICNDDCIAIKHGLSNTDTDTKPEQWFEYSFNDTSFDIGKDQGTSVIFFRITTEEKYHSAIEIAFYISANYSINSKI